MEVIDLVQCERVALFVDGLLAAEDAALFREHLAGCSKCQGALEVDALLRAAGRQVGAGEGEVGGGGVRRVKPEGPAVGFRSTEERMSMEPKILVLTDAGGMLAPEGYVVATPKREGVRRAYLKAIRAQAVPGQRAPVHYLWDQEPTVFASEDEARAAYGTAVEQGAGLK